MAYSEFGRRVKANASQGTDHGTAGPVFVAGDRSRAGSTATSRQLTDLDNGDLKATADFRVGLRRGAGQGPRRRPVAGARQDPGAARPHRLTASTAKVSSSTRARSSPSVARRSPTRVARAWTESAGIPAGEAQDDPEHAAPRWLALLQPMR